MDISSFIQIPRVIEFSVCGGAENARNRTGDTSGAWVGVRIGVSKLGSGKSGL